MNAEVVIYTGSKPVYNLIHPTKFTFYKDVPVAVSKLLYQHLPKDIIKYDPGRHNVAKDAMPIFVSIPQRLAEVLAFSASLRRIRECHPINPLMILSRKDYRYLFPDLDNVEFNASYSIRTGQFYREYHCKYYKSSPCFQPHTLEKWSMEFAYLQHLGIAYGNKPNVPTLLSIDRKSEFITIIKGGHTRNSSWDELGDYLSGQSWGCQTRLIDDNTKEREAFEVLSESKYVISVGDNDCTYLAAYMGIPFFAFSHFYPSVYSRQLDMFGNISKRDFAITSPFVTHRTVEEIYTQLRGDIDNLMAGKALVGVEKKRNKVELPNKGMRK